MQDKLEKSLPLIEQTETSLLHNKISISLIF